MRSLHVSVLCIIGFCVSSSCAKKQPADADPKAATDQLVVSIDGKSFGSSQPAIVSVSFSPGRAGRAELSVAIDDELSLVVQAPLSALPKLRAPVLDGPLRADSTSANLVLAGKRRTDGEVAVALAKGRIEASWKGTTLRVDGNVAVSCAVEASRLKDAIVAPSAPDGQAVPLVDDVEFQTTECQSVKRILL